MSLFGKLGYVFVGSVGLERSYEVGLVLAGSAGLKLSGETGFFLVGSAGFGGGNFLGSAFRFLRQSPLICSS